MEKFFLDYGSVFGVEAIDRGLEGCSLCMEGNVAPVEVGFCSENVDCNCVGAVMGA